MSKGSCTTVVTGLVSSSVGLEAALAKNTKIMTLSEQVCRDVSFTKRKRRVNETLMSRPSLSVNICTTLIARRRRHAFF